MDFYMGNVCQKLVNSLRSSNDTKQFITNLGLVFDSAILKRTPVYSTGAKSLQLF